MIGSDTEIFGASTFTLIGFVFGMITGALMVNIKIAAITALIPIIIMSSMGANPFFVLYEVVFFMKLNTVYFNYWSRKTILIIITFFDNTNFLKYYF